MSIITKTFAAEIKTEGEGIGPNQFLSTISAPTLDRDGEIVDSMAFAPLPARIPVDIDHTMRVLDVVGSGPPTYLPDGSMQILGDWADTDTAQTVRSLVKGGHVNSMSITFRAAQREIDQNDGLPHIRKGELLNVAFVVIPSNREAVVMAAKAAGIGADTVELDAVEGLRADVQRLAAELDELKATVAELTTKTFPEAPEAAPDESAAEPAVDERAAARQRTAEKARAWLARTPSTPRTEGAITQ